MELSVIKQGDSGVVVLLDDDMRIVKPVYAYLKQQARLERSFNTIIANGRDLKLYWEFLNYMGYEYTEVTPITIGEFIEFLRSSEEYMNDNLLRGQQIRAIWKKSENFEKTRKIWYCSW